MEKTQSVLVMDIETQTFGKPDSSKDRLRIFGCYSYKTNKTYLLTNKADIQKVVDAHKILIGFNNAGTKMQPGYDNPILEREGISLKYKIIIDLRNVIVDRAAIIKIDKGLLKDLLMEQSLDFITRILGIVDENEAKIKIDYSLFMKDVWSAEEMKEIAVYTKRDIEVTKKLYEWCETFFEPFKNELRQEDIDKKVYLSASTAKFTYKAICKELNWQEEYESSYDTSDEEKIGGGYVSYPAGERFEDCLYLDVNSLYPFIMIQCNLHGRRKVFDERPFWNGGNVWKTEGSYYSDKLSPIGELLLRWYKERIVMRKNNDKREYAKKIELNCFSYDTDILTIDGIKNIKNIKVGDLIYSLNPKTKETEIKPVVYTTIQEYSGEMVQFRTSNVDLLVTPNHKMYYITRRSKKIQAKKAKDIYNMSSISYPLIKKYTEGTKIEKLNISYVLNNNYIYFFKAIYPYKYRQLCKEGNFVYSGLNRAYETNKYYDGYDDGSWYIQGRKYEQKIPLFLDIKDLFYLIGIFIAEGYIGIIKEKNYENGNYRGITYRISIAKYEEKTYYYKKIKDCLDRLNIKYTAHKKGFLIFGKVLYDLFYQFKRNAFDIKIPSWVWKFNIDILSKLYEGMYDGDGTKLGSEKYSTVSFDLAKDVLRLNFLFGKRAIIHKELMRENKYIYRIVVHKYLPQFKKINNSIIKNNSDKVYCVNVADNHTVFAGRNGKFVWTGQTTYGLLDTPYYKRVYDKIAAGDCTRIGRQWIKLFRQRFREAGFINIMTDTDSVVVKGDKEEILRIKDNTIKEILSTVPFPQELFDMKIEAEVKYIYFFKGTQEEKFDEELDADDFLNKGLSLMKKNYVYVTTDDKLVIKNLGIQKKSNTPLSKKIFWEYLVPEIKKGTIKFKKTFIKNLMQELLLKDLSLITLRKEVGKLEQYVKSPNSIHAQIAARYGQGIHFIIPNTAGIGVGKDKKYCTMEEFKNKGLSINNIDLDNVWKELDYFLIPTKVMNLFDFVEEKNDKVDI